MPVFKFSELTFVSSNSYKHREYCNLIGLSDLKNLSVKIEEPQSLNLEMLVREKVNRLIPKLPDIPFFVEHTGLSIEAWNGLPGGLIGQFMDCVGNEGICKMMQAYQEIERSAKATVVIGYYSRKSGCHVFQGDVFGTIASKPRGSKNFGWDAIFIPEGDIRTYRSSVSLGKSRSKQQPESFST